MMGDDRMRGSEMCLKINAFGYLFHFLTFDPILQEGLYMKTNSEVA